jgi:hypothetical protein
MAGEITIFLPGAHYLQVFSRSVLGYVDGPWVI